MTNFDSNSTNLAYDLYRRSQKDAFVFSYRGPFCSELTSKFLRISEQILDHNGDLRKVNRRFSFLLVETFQNILKHGMEIDSKAFGHFSFKNVENVLSINSINLVGKEQVAELEAVVKEINNLSQNELKSAWKSKLQNGRLSDKGGAGLGLIEIARRSGQQVKYRLDESETECKEFHQQVIYEYESGSEIKDLDFIDQTERNNSEMKGKDILFEYKGAMSQNMIIPMMRIIENCARHNGPTKAKINLATHVLMEMLQNIPDYTSSVEGKKEGVCVIQKDGMGFILSTGNVIPNAQIPELMERLDSLTSKTVNELKLMHLNRMKEITGLDNTESTKLGLIEIVRFCEGKLSYKFERLTDEMSYISIRVVV